MRKLTNSVAKFDYAILEVEKLRDFLIEMDDDFNDMEDIVKEIQGKRLKFIKDNFFCTEEEAKQYVLKNTDDEVESFNGVLVAQNKLIDELSVGYTLYFKTPLGLRKYSAFNWSIV